MLGADIALIRSGPAGKERRPHALVADLGRNQRILADLLGTDEEAAPVDERRTEDRVLGNPDGRPTDAGEGSKVLALISIGPERFALAEAVWDDAVVLDPFETHPHRAIRTRHLPRLRGSAPLP